MEAADENHDFRFQFFGINGDVTGMNLDLPIT